MFYAFYEHLKHSLLILLLVGLLQLKHMLRPPATEPYPASPASGSQNNEPTRRSAFADDNITNSGTRLAKRAQRTNESPAITVGASKVLSYYVPFLSDNSREAAQRLDMTEGALEEFTKIPRTLQSYSDLALRALAPSGS